MIAIVNLELLRSEAFNFLGRYPEFAAHVIELIEEIEKERDRIFVYEKVRGEDSQIIIGLIDALKTAEVVCKAVDDFTENKVDEIVVYRALEDWKKANKQLVTPS